MAQDCSAPQRRWGRGQLAPCHECLSKGMCELARACTAPIPESPPPHSRQTVSPCRCAPFQSCLLTASRQEQLWLQGGGGEATGAVGDLSLPLVAHGESPGPAWWCPQCLQCLPSDSTQRRSRERGGGGLHIAHTGRDQGMGSLFSPVTMTGRKKPQNNRPTPKLPIVWLPGCSKAPGWQPQAVWIRVAEQLWSPCTSK